jgi:hypothetical protein
MWVNKMENDGEADSAPLVPEQTTQLTYPRIPDGIGELQVEKTLLDCFRQPGTLARFELVPSHQTIRIGDNSDIANLPSSSDATVFDPFKYDVWSWSLMCSVLAFISSCSSSEWVLATGQNGATHDSCSTHHFWQIPDNNRTHAVYDNARFSHVANVCKMEKSF